MFHLLRIKIYDFMLNDFHTNFINKCKIKCKLCQLKMFRKVLKKLVQNVSIFINFLPL